MPLPFTSFRTSEAQSGIQEYLMGLNLIVSWGRVSFSVGMCILNCAAVEGAAYSLNALNCGCKKDQWR